VGRKSYPTGILCHFLAILILFIAYLLQRNIIVILDPDEVGYGAMLKHAERCNQGQRADKALKSQSHLENNRSMSLRPCIHEDTAFFPPCPPFWMLDLTSCLVIAYHVPRRRFPSQNPKPPFRATFNTRSHARSSCSTILFNLADAEPAFVDALHSHGYSARILCAFLSSILRGPPLSHFTDKCLPPRPMHQHRTTQERCVTY